MRIISVNQSFVARRVLAEAVAMLRRGGVIAFPTDTAYGLAADPANAAAVRQVYAIKERNGRKPLPLIAASFAQADRTAEIAGAARRLARRHWPGPLTVVVPRKRGGETVAIRVPASVWARALARAFGRPITSTSANISGSPELYSGRAVFRVFSGRGASPDLVLDAGRLPRRRPSTIIRANGRGVAVLRRGPIAIGAPFV